MLTFFFPGGQDKFVWEAEMQRWGSSYPQCFPWPSLPGIWPIKQEANLIKIFLESAAVLEAPAGKGSRIIQLAFTPESQLTQVGPCCLGMEECESCHRTPGDWLCRLPQVPLVSLQ